MTKKIRKNTEWWLALRAKLTKKEFTLIQISVGTEIDNHNMEHNEELKNGSTYSQHHLVNKLSFPNDLNVTFISDLENLGTSSYNLRFLYF